MPASLAYCGEESTAFWLDNGDIGSCWRTLVISAPLFLACTTLLLHSILFRQQQQQQRASLAHIGALDKARILLLLALIVERLVALGQNLSQPYEYVDVLALGIFPLALLLGLLITEATRAPQQQQHESPALKWLAVLIFATNLLLLFSQTQDKTLLRSDKVRALITFACSATTLFLISCIARTIPRHTNNDLDEPLLPSSSAEGIKTVSPEDEAGWFSLLTFTWMSQLMNNAQISMTDLYPLCAQDASKLLKQSFMQALGKVRPDSSLVPVLYASGAITPFILAAPLKLIYDGLMYFAPSYLLREFITFIASDETSAEGEEDWWNNRGTHLAIALFTVAAVQTFILQAYFSMVYRSGMRARAALVTAMYDKALRLSPDQQSSTVANLVSTDAGRIQDLFAYLHVIWSSPFQIILCMYLLSRELGVTSALVSFGLIAFIVFGGTKLLSDRTKAMNKVFMTQKDARVKKTLEMLNSIKLIKLYGMEAIFKDSITTARDEELKILRSYVFLNASTKMISAITPFVVLVTTLGTFVALGGELDPATAFVSITLLQLLRFPMNMLPSLLTGLIEGLNSLQRIQAFLSLEELSMAPSDTSTDAGSEKLAVKLRGSFLWNKDTMALEDVDFSLQEGEFCIVRGSVGSGKTALLLALLGELEPAGDKAQHERVINGTVSYAGQVPWIRNASIRDNILLGEAYEEDFYLRCLDAACLLPDLAQLANGDLTDIGEKGINLSGGQKARISLARCLYSRSDILLLESVFEAVDEHVQGEIWKRGFFGLLRETRSRANRMRTAVIVTHCMKPETRMVDRVVKITKGRLTELPVDEDCEGGSEERAPSRAVTPPAPSPIAASAAARANEGAPVVKSIMTVETSTTNTVAGQESKAYGLYVRAIGGWTVVALQMFIASLRTGNDVGSSRWLAYWANDVEHGVDRELEYYLGIYFAFAVVAVVLFALMFLSIYLSGIKASFELHSQLLDSIVRAPMSFFDSTPLGRITQRFTKDLLSLDIIVPAIVITLYQVCFDAFGTVLVVAIVSPIFLFALPFMAFVYLSVKTVYVRTSRELKNLDSISLSPVLSQFSEVSYGCVSIRAFRKTHEFMEENFAKLDANLAAYYLMNSANRWLAVRIEFIGNFLLLFASMLTASKHGTVSAAMAGMALSYTMNITQSLNWVVRCLGELETNIVSVERISEYSSEIEHERDVVDDLTPISWPERGEIEFDQVSVRYRADLDDVLKQVSFKIPAGAHVGCVGQTGCGKSTLLLTLLRIVEPGAQGRILIDGVDTKTVQLERLRNAMSIIPQDAVVFQNTVRFNLDPGLVKEDVELWRALDRCELSDFVREKFGGLDAQVTGNEFSFGQRQLFCIARALLRNTKILLSDEASSGIDRDTDAKLRRMIQQEFRNVTTLTIAHRLETIAQSDLILVLDFGRVVEFDAPQALLAKKESKFASLVNEMNKKQ